MAKGRVPSLRPARTGEDTPAGCAFESCTVHGSRTFKSFAALRCRVPALSAKNPFPNLSHHAHKYSQESRQCRESGQRLHHVSGHRQPMQHTPFQLWNSPRICDILPYLVFLEKTVRCPCNTLLERNVLHKKSMLNGIPDIFVKLYIAGCRKIMIRGSLVS